MRETKALIFEVYDHDTFSDDLIGYFKVSVEELPFDKEVELTERVLPFPKKKAPGGGNVLIRILRR